jgi:hypothetical protein
LEGRRLHGEFALVRFTGKRKEWLLVKKRDAEADTTWEIERALTPFKRKAWTRKVLSRALF